MYVRMKINLLFSNIMKPGFLCLELTFLPLFAFNSAFPFHFGTFDIRFYVFIFSNLGVKYLKFNQFYVNV